jgi:hypothetical protein
MSEDTVDATGPHEYQACTLKHTSELPPHCYWCGEDISDARHHA